jgi:hypothetical protein
MVEQLLIEINHKSELDEIFAFLNKQNIKYKSKSIPKVDSEIEMSKQEIIDKIKSGGMNIKNFDAFMLDFEESRKDRLLPFRD